MTDDQPTLKALQDRAAELEIDGRSKMSREQLVDAIAAAEAAQAGHIAAVPPTTEQQAATEAVAETVDAPQEPTPADVVGRPDLVDVARQRAAARNPRVIGAPTQEA